MSWGCTAAKAGLILGGLGTIAGTGFYYSWTFARNLMRFNSCFCSNVTTEIFTTGYCANMTWDQRNITCISTDEQTMSGFGGLTYLVPITLIACSGFIFLVCRYPNTKGTPASEEEIPLTNRHIA